MDKKSDSDESYDKVSWEEFCIGLSDSDVDGIARSKKSVNHETDDSDSDQPLKEQNKDIGLTVSEHFSVNSSYGNDDDSVDGDSDGDVASSDPEDNFVIDMLERVVAVNYRRMHALEVPGIFENPTIIKRREDMEIKDLVKDHALPFLPAKSLARFKAVSKEWKQWISSPFLAYMQTNLFRGLSGFFCQVGYHMDPTYLSIDEPSSGIHSPSLNFLPEGVTIRSSCYGLLLCQGINNDSAYYVCNPVNREYQKIPKPHFYHGRDPAIVLAFEPSILNIESNFEIICAIPVGDHPIVYFETYSSQTGLWSQSPAESIEVESSKILGGGFYVNKIAYFMTDSGLVLGFDVKSEVCGVFSLPSDCEWNGVLTRMDGELCYVHVSHLEENKYNLRVYGGMDMSIKRNRSIFLHDLGFGPDSKCQILPFVTNNSNDVVVLAGKEVWLYDLIEDRGNIIGYAMNSRAKYWPFVSSLVHLPPE